MQPISKWHVCVSDTDTDSKNVHHNFRTELGNSGHCAIVFNSIIFVHWQYIAVCPWNSWVQVVVVCTTLCTIPSYQPDFLECHIKIKSYQPFWCWNFLITHEFGQIFSYFVLKICCSVKILRLSDRKWHFYG